MRGLTHIVSCCAAFALFQPPTIGAQGDAGRGVIAGFVRDSAGNPVDRAEVSLGGVGGRTITGGDGAFHFAYLARGTYDVGVRRIGYYPDVRTVTVTDTVALVRFALVSVASILPPVVTAVARGGVSGVVRNSARQGIPDARIAVLGINRDTTSDSTGSFFVDVKPGRYVLRIAHDSFATSLASVTVPRDSGRRVVVGLRRVSRRVPEREALSLFDLRSRLATRTAAMGVYTREDMDKLQLEAVDRIASLAASRPVERTCPAFIDGDVGRLRPLWLLRASELELLEVYPARPAGFAVRNQPTDIPRGPGTAGCPRIYAWLRM